MNSDNSKFRLLTRCDFSLIQVHINWNPVLPGLPEPVSEKIDHFWETHVENTAKKSFIFNGQLGGISGWHQSGQQFVFDLVMAEYKRLYYAKERYEADADLIERHQLSAVLGISVILISADNHLVLIERSGSVGEAPGKLDFIGGHIDPVCHLLDGIPNPFLAIREELVEEVGLEVPPQDLRLAGLITTVAPAKPEAFFLLRSSLDTREIISLGAEKQCGEIAGFVTVQNDAAAVGQFARQNEKNLSPSALGGIWLYHNSLI